MAIRKQKSLSKKDNGANGQSAKIEVMDCQNNGEKCKEHLAVINENYLESYQYLEGKNFRESIASLKNAFEKTHELQDTTCLKCAQLFRDTITESLEDIRDELQKMSTGIFKTKRYQSSYDEACDVLEELKKGK
ncbi:hypothetical protein D1164_08130 [Mariniphaga sediminis]|uniref:Uncharacterized protein n=1 Tax=Mariniphaga sediminis TaxID=1628158 RepID=A0A399D0U5_9BACT|nr:hypothetical protein [Mariniphaga sediminis]RIH65625.1 hypothetical protein D1164_08130 [Mariniphaga sediminis]